MECWYSYVNPNPPCPISDSIMLYLNDSSVWCCIGKVNRKAHVLAEANVSSENIKRGVDANPRGGG